MKKIAVLCGMLAAVSFVTGCSSTQKSGTELQVGRLAPDFSVTDQHGQTVQLSELHKDGPLVLTFLRSFF